MSLKFSLPHPALSDFIEGYFYMDMDFSGAGSPKNSYDFFPTHKRFITLYLDEGIKVKTYNSPDFQPKRGDVIIGPQLHTVSLDLGLKHRMVAIGLKPGGMYRLLGIPMHEMVDANYSSQELMGKHHFHQLTERLNNTFDFATIIQWIDHCFLSLLSTLKPLKSIDIVMQKVSAQLFQTHDIDFLAYNACLSSRQFERLSLQRLGLPPRTFLRLIRFSRAYSLKERFPLLNWTAIAHASGYFDQSHFIRDFKDFAGIKPSFAHENLINSVAFHSSFG